MTVHFLCAGMVLQSIRSLEASPGEGPRSLCDPRVLGMHVFIVLCSILAPSGELGAIIFPSWGVLGVAFFRWGVLGVAFF